MDVRKRTTRQRKTLEPEDGNTMVQGDCTSFEKDFEKLRGPTGRMLQSKQGVLSNIDLISMGQWDRRWLYEKKVRNALVEEKFTSLEPQPHCNFNFKMRITALCWHPGYPNVIGAGSKHGEILVGSVAKGDECMELKQKCEIAGLGAGGSITAMKFDPREPLTLFRTSIDSTVKKINFVNQSESIIYHDFGSYEQWFTSMDVDFSKNVLLAGDNTGKVYMFSVDGASKGEFKLHKSKVHHIEFNLKDPNMFVTSCIGTTTKTDIVKIWDIRQIKQPLYSLPHNCAVNVAKFNPLNGSRLLTSDQKDEVRVYQGPFWDSDPLIIKHPHSQFQHITAIKADWHPFSDTIVIGRYPKNKEEDKMIELFDADTGNRMGQIKPPANKICSLNTFNVTGELLASGISSQLVVWKPVVNIEDSVAARRLGVSSSTMSNVELSQDMKNRIRGGRSAPRQRRRAEYSPANSDDEADANDPARSKKLKREKKTAPATRSSESAGTATRSRAAKSNSASNNKSSSASNVNKKVRGKK